MAYTKGNPYFIEFRPLLHNPLRICDGCAAELCGKAAGCAGCRTGENVWDPPPGCPPRTPPAAQAVMHWGDAMKKQKAARAGIFDKRGFLPDNFEDILKAVRTDSKKRLKRLWLEPAE